MHSRREHALCSFQQQLRRCPKVSARQVFDTLQWDNAWRIKLALRNLQQLCRANVTLSLKFCIITNNSPHADSFIVSSNPLVLVPSSPFYACFSRPRAANVDQYILISFHHNECQSSLVCGFFQIWGSDVCYFMLI